MYKVHFPKTKVPIITRLRNIVKTKGDILTPKEHSYAEFLTKELRDCVDPWAREPWINDSVIADIRREFIEKVKTEEPQEHKKIIKNVEDYVYKEARYHYDKMSDPLIQNKLTNPCTATDKVWENATKKDSYMQSIEKILGSALDGWESWQEIEEALKINHINRKQRDFCKTLYQKAQKYDKKRVAKIIERENQIAANEAAAKQYGLWKSYDYVYNMPQQK